MANAKSLGSNSGMNRRPTKSLNQNASTQNYHTIQRVNATQQRDVSNASSRQLSQSQPVRKSLNNNAPQVVQNDQQVNPISNFVEVMKKMVSSFAIIDQETVNQNLNLALGNGMTIDDRTISFECADYLISNMAFIFMGLVLDSNFKNAFTESLMVELKIDSQPEDAKKKARDAMKNDKAHKSNGSIVLGLTTFMPNVGKELMNKMNQGFANLDAFADEFDAEVAKLTDEQKVEYGFIFSNFMYLIRAFTHNDMFMAYVITVIEKVKSILSDKK